MTKQEFENLTGALTTDAQFDYANRVYMAAGDMKKETFCEAWKDDRVSESKIVSALTMEVECTNAALKTANDCYDRAAQSLRDFSSQMADFLILQAEKWSASDLREKAIKLVGIKEYLRRRIEFGFGLWADDKKALDEILRAA